MGNTFNVKENLVSQIFLSERYMDITAILRIDKNKFHYHQNCFIFAFVITNQREILLVILNNISGTILPRWNVQMNN